MFQRSMLCIEKKYKKKGIGEKKKKKKKNGKKMRKSKSENKACIVV